MRNRITRAPWGACWLLGALLLLAPSGARSKPPIDGCTITGPGGLAFPDYDPLSPTDTTTVATFEFECGSRDKMRITIDRGANSTTFNPRRMRGDTDFLSYNIYLEPTFQTIWGDGVDPSTRSWTRATPHVGTVSLYARIFALQDVSAGDYADVVTVTFEY